MEPFGLTIFAEDLFFPDTRITATSDPIPAGKLFVVEHISGAFTTAVSDDVNRIIAIGLLAEQEVYLPKHFTGSILGGSPGIPSTQTHQFGSPVKMYVSEGNTITIQCDASYSVSVRAIVMGYLVDL